MYGRDLRRRSLASDTTRSRQVYPTAGGARTAILERSGPDLPPPPLRPAKVQLADAPDDASGEALIDSPADDSEQATRATTGVPLLRKPGGQVLAVLALVLGVWLIVLASDGSMRSELGSDIGGLSPERAALVRLLDGVLGRVENGSGGGEGAEFGASAGPDGRPPTAPGMIGRDQPGSSGLGPSPTPEASASESTDLGAEDQLRQGADGDLDSDIEVPEGSDVTSSTVTSSQPSDPTPSVTAPSPTTSTTTTTAAPTSAPSTTTTAPPPTSTVPSTPTTPAGCTVVLSQTLSLWASPKGKPTEIGQVGPGTYAVSERFGAKWYRIAGGWVRDGGGLTPQSC